MRRLAAAITILTCAFGATHAGFVTADEAATAVTSDADLKVHLEHQRKQRTRLYRAVHRREWAGAAAGLIELRSAKASSPRATPPSAGPAPLTAPATPASGSVWDRLAQCESTGHWAAATGNGYWGGLQFTLSSWEAAGGTGMPNHASREEQIARGQRLQAMQGWGAWPHCSRQLGLR